MRKRESQICRKEKEPGAKTRTKSVLLFFFYIKIQKQIGVRTGGG